MLPLGRKGQIYSFGRKKIPLLQHSRAPISYRMNKSWASFCSLARSHSISLFLVNFHCCFSGTFPTPELVNSLTRKCMSIYFEQSLILVNFLWPSVFTLIRVCVSRLLRDFCIISLSLSLFHFVFRQVSLFTTFLADSTPLTFSMKTALPS